MGKVMEIIKDKAMEIRLVKGIKFGGDIAVEVRSPDWTRPTIKDLGVILRSWYLNENARYPKGRGGEMTVDYIIAFMRTGEEPFPSKKV